MYVTTRLRNYVGFFFVRLEDTMQSCGTVSSCQLGCEQMVPQLSVILEDVVWKL